MYGRHMAGYSFRLYMLQLCCREDSSCNTLLAYWYRSSYRSLKVAVGSLKMYSTKILGILKSGIHVSGYRASASFSIGFQVDEAV